MTETIDLTAFDVGDDTDRVVLADALADAGREVEAAILRDGNKVAVYYHDQVRDAATLTLVERIEVAHDLLGDLGVHESNCNGIVVYADDELPRGWVRVSDGTGTAIMASEVLLAELTGFPACHGDENDADALWLVLSAYPDSAQDIDWHDLSDDLSDVAFGGRIYRLETNAGRHYTACLDPETTSQIREAYEYDLWFETAAEAVAQYNSWLEEQAWHDGQATNQDVEVAEDDYLDTAELPEGF